MREFVIEVKYTKEMKELDAACEAAMAQIKNKRYDEALRDEDRCDSFSLWHCIFAGSGAGWLVRSCRYKEIHCSLMKNMLSVFS